MTFRTFFSALFLLFAPVLLSHHSFANQKEVVVYTSVDQVFSEPILRQYEKISGVRVKVVYDVEAAKTVGLVNRLIAEKNRPRADVFWNSEIIRTLVLQEKNILTPYLSDLRKDIPEQFKDKDGYWTGFGCRARVLIYNTDILSPEQVPSSIFELTDPRWHGKAAIAYPILGTAATHAGGLFSSLGEEKARDFFQGLKNNDVLVVSGNSIVRDVVAAGEVAIGLTDTDDVQVAIARNLPVNMVFPDQNGVGTFFIPNSVALIKNGPNPEMGKRLIDYLLSPDVEQMLSLSESRNIPVRPGVTQPKDMPRMDELHVMDVSFQQAARMLPLADSFNRDLFAF